MKIWSTALIKDNDQHWLKYQKVESMKYTVYLITSPEDKTYVGVTQNFKRRWKEHWSSKTPLGEAIRKYGKENFKLRFERFDTKEQALEREYELVNLDTLQEGKLYNQTVGGSLDKVLVVDNPMRREGVVEKHSNIWTSRNNPMNCPDTKDRMIKSQKRKRVFIEGVEYDGVREAARKLGTYRQLVVYRLKSPNFPDWYYL